jgi:predicted RNA binding protein YcfA (HicA-like mRNA interferase family)
MKRRALLGHLQEHGCVPFREVGSHSIWQNPQTGRKEAIPRHSELFLYPAIRHEPDVSDQLAAFVDQSG